MHGPVWYASTIARGAVNEMVHGYSGPAGATGGQAGSLDTGVDTPGIPGAPGTPDGAQTKLPVEDGWIPACGAAVAGVLVERIGPYGTSTHYLEAHDRKQARYLAAATGGSMLEGCSASHYWIMGTMGAVEESGLVTQNAGTGNIMVITGEQAYRYKAADMQSAIWCNGIYPDSAAKDNASAQLTSAAPRNRSRSADLFDDFEFELE